MMLGWHTGSQTGNEASKLDGWLVSNYKSHVGRFDLGTVVAATFSCYQNKRGREWRENLLRNRK